MTDLISKQSVLQRSIERSLENFKKVGRANLTSVKIRTRIATLKESWMQYQDGHAALLRTIPAKERTALDYFNHKEFDATEDVFQTTLDHMTEILEELDPPVSPIQSFDNSRVLVNSATLSHTHMPKIQLPLFDGNYSNWESFRDRFSALIIQNHSLSDFARMHYLVSSLKGRALDSINNISVTADNFSIAWSTLTARFENKNRLIASHFSALFGLSAVHKESASDLQLLVDKCNIAVASLKNLDRTASDLWDDFLVHLLTQRLDSASRKAWNMKHSDTDTPPSYEELNRFLRSRIRALEECSSNASERNNKSASRLSVATTSANNLSACPLCKSRHYLSACSKFNAQNPTQRRETVKRFKRCFNCLSASHTAQDCKSQYSCRTCNKRHHSLLHRESDSEQHSATAVKPSEKSVSAIDSHEDGIQTLSATTASLAHTRVLLATARVKITTASGRSAIVRVLLDQGSEATFISETLAQTLKIRRIRTSVSISAVGGNHIGMVRQAATITITQASGEGPAFTTTALILNSLTAYAPQRVSDLSALDHLSDLNWADHDPTGSTPIHVIIGADLYSSIICKGIKKGRADQPIAQNSVFGWIISGPLSMASPSQRSSIHISMHHCISLQDLNYEIKKFWETEELQMSKPLSPEEEQCENHFKTTHSRASDGQYIVRLPFISNLPIDIGHSRLRAEQQLQSLSRRLASQPSLMADYQAFMREYEALGHMCQATQVEDSPPRHVYIPHHPVFKRDSTTTRLRVVFNASCLTSNGSSLNDHLMAGPKLQADLSAVILLWRQFRFVYTADIAKMYRQIRIDSRDVDYQRILWYSDHSQVPCDYQLLTVTYGMKCAPYLALRVLRALADDDGHRFPLAVPILRKHVYVDDILFGSHDPTSLRQIRDQLTSLLRCGHFDLRKWASNSSHLLNDIEPSNHGLACSKTIADDDQIKVLGIFWNPSRDTFQFKVSLDNSVPSSKRAILSTIARLYDPLGWVTPVTVAAKIFMQQLWRSQIDWDDQISESLLSRWRLIYTSLSHLNNVHINRWTRFQPDSRVELHGFADASTVAYAASLYIRITSPDNAVSISLLVGKSKVAPIKPLTIPRLELSAALLLSRIVNVVRTTLNLNNVPCTCWTDSTIVLTWIRSHPSRWTTFVANRVQQIQTMLPGVVWRHVPTISNPADCASRGLRGDEILSHELWWQGPSWLKSLQEEWPQEPSTTHADAHTEEQRSSCHVTSSDAPWSLATRYSSWPKLIRVTAYLFKFANLCRPRQPKSPDSYTDGATISSADFSLSRRHWIKQIQKELFPTEIQALGTGRTIPSRSSLAALTPFLDGDKLLRVGGRLRHAPLPYDVRHPILLASHPVVRILIAHVHMRTLHGGLQLTLNTLRQDYWILRARSLTKSVIHHCVTCVRERASIPTQLMGDLPSARVTPPSRPFTHSGLDYAGPIRIRASGGRGIAARKAYIALFVCLATRAVHLELVSDLSTQAFMGAFTRFCSRRGLPQSVYSDNGTAFVGADREISLAYRAALQDATFQNTTASDGISWHFIPPSAPHFGGLWEAGVRSVKHHLRRILGDRTLTFEEFSTLLCKIEACLNSRPLAPLSDSYDDYQVITPGHFLIGSALTAPPAPTLLSLEESRLSRWQIVRQITERFWKIWTNDYVNTLQQRGKWRKIEPSVHPGRLVLLRNPNMPPCKWELGRVIKVHSGSDGLTRVVTVRTAASEYVRPIGQICLLPIASAPCN